MDWFCLFLLEYASFRRLVCGHEVFFVKDFEEFSGLLFKKNPYFLVIGFLSFDCWVLSIQFNFIPQCVFCIAFFACIDEIHLWLLLKTNRSVIHFFSQRYWSFVVILRLPQYLLSEWYVGTLKRTCWLVDMLVPEMCFCPAKTSKNLNFLRCIQVLDKVLKRCWDINKGNSIHFSYSSLCMWT